VLRGELPTAQRGPPSGRSRLRAVRVARVRPSQGVARPPTRARLECEPHPGRNAPITREICSSPASMCLLRARHRHTMVALAATGYECAIISLECPCATEPDGVRADSAGSFARLDRQVGAYRVLIRRRVRAPYGGAFA